MLNEDNHLTPFVGSFLSSILNAYMHILELRIKINYTFQQYPTPESQILIQTLVWVHDLIWFALGIQVENSNIDNI